MHRRWEILQNFKFYNRPNWDGRKLMMARLPLQYKYPVPVKFCLLFYLSASQDKLQRNRRNCLEDDFYRPLGYFRPCLPPASGLRLIRKILQFPLFWVGSIPRLSPIHQQSCRIYLKLVIFLAHPPVHPLQFTMLWREKRREAERERCNLHWWTALTGAMVTLKRCRSLHLLVKLNIVVIYVENYCYM